MATNPAVAGLAQLRNLVSDLRPTDWGPGQILRVSPEETTLTTVLSGTGRMTKQDFEFKIVEQETQPSFITVASVTSDTVFVVSADDAKIITANTPLRLDDDTVLYISDVTGTNVTVESGATGLEGKKLVIGARAFEENSSAPDAMTWQPAIRTGYQQTYRFAWGNSRWMRLVKTFINETRIVADGTTARMEVKRTVERGLIFNPARKIAGPPIRYYAGGLFDQNNVNVWDVEGDGTLTYEMLDDYLTAMKYSGMELWGLTSPEVCGVLRKLAWKKSNADTFVRRGSLGVPYVDIEVGTKRLRLFESNHFVGEFQYMLHILDKRNVKITTTVDQDTGKSQWMLLETNAETPGTDGTLNILTVDFGLWLPNRQSHSLIRNIRKAGE